MNKEQLINYKDEYRYRPVLFFLCAYFFTWIFWIPAIFVPETTGSVLMLIGLIATAVVSIWVAMNIIRSAATRRMLLRISIRR